MPTAYSRADAGSPLDIAVARVDAADEQAWNDAILADGPVRSPLLRLWRYRAAAVVLGRSQQALARRAASAETALPLVERRAGGGAVLVGPWMLSMSLVLPVDHGWLAGRSTGASYDQLGLAWTEALHAFGVDARPAEPADAGPAPPGLAWACFAGITQHEVLVGRRKIVGLAQRRHRHGVLYVAGALLDPVPWPSLVAIMRPLLPSSDGVAVSDERQLAGLANETVSMAEVRGAAVSAEALIEVVTTRITERLRAAAP